MKNIIRRILKEVGSKRDVDTKVIYKDNNIVILIPLSYESAKSYSRGTQYCTGGDYCNTSEKTLEDMFKYHTEKGDILYRIFFKNGIKIRLTWDGNMSSHNFHWGLGRKDSYPVFTSRNMENPFDVEKLSRIRDEQLKIKPKIEKLKRWEKNFCRKWKIDNNMSQEKCENITNIRNLITKKWTSQTKLNVKEYFYGEGGFTNDKLSNHQKEQIKKEVDEVFNLYHKNIDKIFGGESNYISYWWSDNYEILYQSINNIPKGAIKSMVEYAKEKRNEKYYS